MGRWKCENDCTYCNDEFCDFAVASCYKCGEEFPIWNLLKTDGKYYCLKCYVETGLEVDAKKIVV